MKKEGLWQRFERRLFEYLLEGRLKASGYLVTARTFRGMLYLVSAVDKKVVEFNIRNRKEGEEVGDALLKMNIGPDGKKSSLAYEVVLEKDILPERLVSTEGQPAEINGALLAVGDDNILFGSPHPNPEFRYEEGCYVDTNPLPAQPAAVELVAMVPREEEVYLLDLAK